MPGYHSRLMKTGSLRAGSRHRYFLKSCAVRAESTDLGHMLTSPLSQPLTYAWKGPMAVSTTVLAPQAPISVTAELALYSSRTKGAAGVSKPSHPGLRSLMAPIRSDILLPLPSHQPLTTAALGTTVANMSVLTPLVGHGATAERAMTCCLMERAVRVRRGLLHCVEGQGVLVGGVHPDSS